MGGMAAQIPIKEDPNANAIAMDRVKADKKREVELGHDGTWVAHPALVPVAMEVFDRTLDGRPHQIPTGSEEEKGNSSTPPSTVTAVDLLTPPMVPPLITSAGVRSNVSVCLSYLAPWLCGIGCVPLEHLMEDAATAEISRCQLWQWKTHGAMMEDGKRMTPPLLLATLHEVRDSKRREVGEKRWVQGRWEEASNLIERLLTAPELADFLTLEAYPLLDSHTATPHSGKL
jgi:malate synthase